jgi:shikimate kinase
VRNLYLVGFMGAGKSAVGRALARLTSRVFLDLDEAIEERMSMSIPEVFSARGEAEFRRIEHTELRATSERQNLVVATGGGAYSSADNRRLIDDCGGLSVFLDPPWSVIERRLAGETVGRPKWIDGDQARSLYDARLDDYRTATVHIPIDGDESPDEIAGRVERALSETETACVS